MPFWDALKPKTTSKIWVAQNGRPGNRTLTIEWVDFAHKNDPNASYTFEVVLFEARDMVRFHYINMTGTFADGSMASVGIQGDLSSIFTGQNYGFHKTGLISNGLTVEFGYDSDSDRLPVGIEAQYGTSPTDSTTDNAANAITDGAQIRAGLNPLDPADNAAVTTDSDGDTLLDVEETYMGLNPMSNDTDGDGIADNTELNGTNKTDPLKADTDGDGRKDGDEDANHNAVVDATETNPNRWDTDNDGVSDGDEATFMSDPLDATKSRFGTGASTFTPYGYNMASALDSKGNLHLAWFHRNNNLTPDDLFVALYEPDMVLGYKVTVNTTTITAHTGHDDKMPTIVTVPGSGTIDRTFIIDGDTQGNTWLTEIDFNLAARDGTSSTSGTIHVASTSIPLPTPIQHPHARVSYDGNIHLVYVGSLPYNNQYNFTSNRVDRGVYYAKISLTGTILGGPTELYFKSPPNHPHTHPRIDTDSQGNVHGVFRAGSCGWSTGPTNCSLYYFKLGPDGAVRIQTTKLALDGQGGIDKAPDLAIGPNGNVNIIYASIAPTVSLGDPSNDSGAYDYGRAVYLHTISTVGDIITVLTNQKLLYDTTPKTWNTNGNLSGNPQVNVWHTPTLATDGGGNLHVVGAEDNNAQRGIYTIFDPSGERVVGPFALPDMNMWGIKTVKVKGTRSLFTYYTGGAGAVRNFDFSGMGVDLSGTKQIPPGMSSVTVKSVAPSWTLPGNPQQVTIFGNGFAPGAAAYIGGVALTNMVIWSTQIVSGDFNPGTLAEGKYDVAVKNTDAGTGTLAMAFTIGMPPVENFAVTAVAPSTIKQGTTPDLVVAGTGFVAGAGVTIGGLVGGNPTVLSSNAIQVKAPSGLALGMQDVVVTNGGGATATLTGGLTVTSGSGGCNCHVADASREEQGVWMLVAFGVLVLVRRRRPE
jgi:MYXO-CTERM domain-containing protein